MTQNEPKPKNSRKSGLRSMTSCKNRDPGWRPQSRRPHRFGVPRRGKLGYPPLKPPSKRNVQRGSLPVIRRPHRFGVPRRGKLSYPPLKPPSKRNVQRGSLPVIHFLAFYRGKRRRAKRNAVDGVRPDFPGLPKSSPRAEGTFRSFHINPTWNQ